MIKEDLILIGGGGHCKSCIDVIEMQEKYSIKGILDLKEKIGLSICGYNIIGDDNDLHGISKTIKNFFITIGQIKSPEKRISIFENIKILKLKLPIIISPLAYVSKYSNLGEGSIIMHHAIINTNVHIGSNCIINTKALIEHDSIIGNHCHVSTASVVNGGVIIEDRCFIGSNATIKQNTRISQNSFIQANSFINNHL